MFGKKKQAEAAAAGSVNLIGAGTEIKGDIICKNDLRIDGPVNGRVESNAKIVIGSSGSITGNLHALNADVSGKVIGDVRVEDHLLLKSTSVIQGSIYAGKVTMEAGATVVGKCKMGSAAIESQSTEKGDERKTETPKDERRISTFA